MNKMIILFLGVIVIALIIKIRKDEKEKEQKKKDLKALLDKANNVVTNKEQKKDVTQTPLVKVDTPTNKSTLIDWKDKLVNLFTPKTSKSDAYSDMLGDEAGIQNLIAAGITGGIGYFLYKNTWDRTEMDGIGWKVITVLVALVAAVKLKQALL